jgi:photosystem II stability/assembly factor-like uncharacterized protein
MKARAKWIGGILLANAAVHLYAQDRPANPDPPAPAAPALANDGKPIPVPFQCSEEDIRWAGMSCSEDAPCSVFLELASAEALGNRVLLTGNIHADSVTLYSILLASDDHGLTWREPHERIRGAALDHIEHLGTASAWISGQVLFPISQDPFLLVSADGGGTWKRRDVLGEESESRFGSIQEFYFTTRDRGTLILDRGAGGGGGRWALFESSSGGESWAIRQESRKPIAVGAPPAPAPEWRVRPDAGTKSFVVEHRAGARWTAVAAFLVRLNSCPPPEPAASPAVSEPGSKP